MQNDLLAIGSVMLVICLLVATQIFGHVEFMMLANRMKSVGMSFIQPLQRERVVAIVGPTPGDSRMGHAMAIPDRICGKVAFGRSPH